MITALCSIMIMLGMLLCIFDMFIPPYTIPIVILYTFKMMGIGIAAIGVMILGARIHQTGVGPFIEIPNTKRVILMHQRRGQNPNTYFMNGKLDDLEFIRAKNKVFKDTGGGFRVAGHDVRRTHEVVCHDIPEWLSQYFYQIKNRYGIANNLEFKELRKQLSNLKPPIEGVMNIEQQLEQIKLLKPVMDNDQCRRELLKLNFLQLQKMEEILYDGVTHHGEEAESFIESATPNELDALEKQKFLNEKMEERNYRAVGEHNIGQWIGPALLLMVGGAIAVAIISGAL